jgi:serine/threonine protein kinase
MTATWTEDGSLESLVARVVDEFRERQKRGEQPSPEEYAARHPHAAGALREVLAALRVVELSSAAGLAPAEDRAVTGTLGDFRILREVGRGGMGVVYEAEQISLGRRVALKVLPLAAALDAKLLQRFRNEAHAAAQLHHTNIVPVHAVGCERGVHYFAMQFIDGHNLAALVRQQRRQSGLEAAEESVSPKKPASPDEVGAAETVCREAPTERSIKAPAFFRSVAHLGLQAAEALEHAHQLGIIHRDVKPANLLVDAGGRLWITDFGLAHCQSQSGLTMTGDLVGTLRYMSPEQALGQRQRVDHRTDIYSLGATLYELLTLEPVHNGRDRQELLRQIAGDGPRPPRRLNPAIPADLETVLLKALENEPVGRYASAGEMAEDLRRFLEDKPIRARRPTLVQRARKWAIRHRAVVIAAAVVLATALAVGSVLLATAYRAEAAQRRLAQAKERLAREAADDMYTLMTREWWAGLPKEQSVRDFLHKALHLYQELAEDDSREPAARRQRGEAYLRVGQIQRHLMANQAAEEAFLRASVIFEQLAAELPGVPEHREGLAASYHGRAMLLSSASRPHEAEGHLTNALALMEKVVEEAPTPQRRHNLGLYQLSMAILLHTTGRLEAAEQASRQASEDFARLTEELPTEWDHALGLAKGRHRLGMILLDRQKEGVEVAFRQALVPCARWTIGCSSTRLRHSRRRPSR